MSDDVSSDILFAHAILGCDTTSRMFGVGKGVSLHLVQQSDPFIVQASIFQKQFAIKVEIAAAGEKATIEIYRQRSRFSQ